MVSSATSNLKQVTRKVLTMKWNVVFNNGLHAGHFFCDDKERGFANWCWVNKVKFPDNYMVIPASS